LARPTFVLVHGAWHGSYYWEPLIGRLAAYGYDAVAVDLPSTGRGAGLREDAAVVRAAVDACESAIVVGHSYGGVPMTRGVAGLGNVRHLIYVSAFLLAENEALRDIPTNGDETDWIASEDGATMRVGNPADLFYHRCPPEVAREAARRLRPQSTRAFAQPVLRAAWRTTPSTYVVCDDDRTIPAGTQLGMAKRAGAAWRLRGSDHTPFLSQPDAVAALFSELVPG
jgi:pimeloyl-ACP methyl ester carboxylesterase